MQCRVCDLFLVIAPRDPSFEGKQDVMENTKHSASYETLSKYLHVCPIVEAVCSFLYHVHIYALLMGATLHYAAIAWNGSER